MCVNCFQKLATLLIKVLTSSMTSSTCYENPYCCTVHSSKFRILSMVNFLLQCPPLLLVQKNLVEEIYISGLELQRFESVIFFSKIYIWDVGVRFGYFFRDHVIQISFRLMNFQDIYSELGKVTSFLETFTLSIQILIFMEQFLLNRLRLFRDFKLTVSLGVSILNTHRSEK
jgi:hypothetical protein